mmetsp:Transcript_7733/g.12644  ORF Transcript_7733/g.12644 Transcript_7733/m.12644 type:complete len:419 (+) Transcript_7733:287-1543(+)
MASPILSAASDSALAFSRSTSGSSWSNTSRAAAICASTSCLTSSEILSPWSRRFFSVPYTSESSSLRASMASLRFLSAAALASASLTMFSISASLRPPLLLMTTLCSLPVALSLPETCIMPSASMSKETSICGTPRGAGGMPTRSNWPSSLLSAAISRSPCSTLICTCGWLSAAVENTWLFFVGMVVFRLISLVKTPPSVSMPSESGVTSSSRMSLTSPFSTPPWMAAPMATTSSGFTPLLGARPKNSRTRSCTLGMRLMPPTSSTSEMSSFFSPPSLRQVLQGPIVRATRSSTICSNCAREIFTFMCLGPVASAVMKGSETSVWGSPSSSRLAFSAASRSRCMARASPERSMPLSFLNSFSRCLSRCSSKSSPPSIVSPLVAFTSKTPPLISSTEMSKVPPPRSKTAMSLPSPLSCP